MIDRWDQFFLDLATTHALMSKDPSTQVGAVIVGQNRETLCGGFNGFSRGIQDLECRLLDRDTKYKLIVHAEMNAVLVAARRGISVDGCTMYLVARDTKSGRVWGGAPCVRCLVELIQAGITGIVTYQANVPERWAKDIELSRSLIDECGISYREVA